MINPKEVLNAIQAIFITDAITLGYLQLTDADLTPIIQQTNPPVTPAKIMALRASGIIKRSTYDGIATGKSRCCIYFRPSRKTSNSLTMEDVLEIDVHVPVSRDLYAYDALQRAFSLLDERERRRKDLNPVIAYHLLRWDGQLGDLVTAQNYFCAGARFSCIVTTRNTG